MPVSTAEKTRNESAISFVVRQKESSEYVAQSSGAIFFNVDTMLQGPRLAKSRVRENIKMFSVEHYYRATSRLAYFDGQEWFHPDGESYNDFFDRGIEYYKDNQKLAERFRAEKAGYINAGRIIQQRKAMGSESPALVIGSPPDDIYRNQSFTPRNVTFISIPICERQAQLGEQPEKIYQEYTMYVIPSEEIATNEYWQLLIQAGDLSSSLSALGMVDELVDGGDANFVVATAILLSQVEKATNYLAMQFGYSDFLEIVRETERMLEMDSDPLALQRREDLIDYFTDKMWDYVSRRDELSNKEKLKLKSLADVMHDYLSAEGGFEYIGKTFEDIRKMIEGHTLISQRNVGVTFSSQELEYTDWSYAELAYKDYFVRLASNKITQERRNNAGCPVNLRQSLFDSRFGGFENITGGYGYEQSTYAGLDMSQDYGYVGTTTLGLELNSSGGKPEGVIKEDHHVGCPLCKDCDVTAYYTSNRIHCSKCGGSVALTNA